MKSTNGTAEVGLNDLIRDALVEIEACLFGRVMMGSAAWARGSLSLASALVTRVGRKHRRPKRRSGLVRVFPYARKARKAPPGGPGEKDGRGRVQPACTGDRLPTLRKEPTSRAGRHGRHRETRGTAHPRHTHGTAVTLRGGMSREAECRTVLRSRGVGPGRAMQCVVTQIRLYGSASRAAHSGAPLPLLPQNGPKASRPDGSTRVRSGTSCGASAGCSPTVIHGTSRTVRWL